MGTDNTVAAGLVALSDCLVVQRLSLLRLQKEKMQISVSASGHLFAPKYTPYGKACIASS